MSMTHHCSYSQEPHHPSFLCSSPPIHSVSAQLVLKEQQQLPKPWEEAAEASHHQLHTAIQGPHSHLRQGLMQQQREHAVRVEQPRLEVQEVLQVVEEAEDS